MPGSYPVDDRGRRLVKATIGSPAHTCGPIIFPNGNPPEAVVEPTEDVSDLLASAGPPGVDQDNFYEIYDWAVVVDTGTWMSLLGYPRFESQPHLYGGSYGYVEFALYEERWWDIGSSWCDVEARLADLPPGAGSLSLLWPEEYRQALIRSAAGERTDQDLETIITVASSDEWRNLMGSSAAEWKLDPEVAPDPISPLLPIEIQERRCASGRPPVDRHIVVFAGDHEDGVVLTVFVAPVSGGATCPRNPWYPLTVELDAPGGEHHLYDGAMLPPQPRN